VVEGVGGELTRAALAHSLQRCYQGTQMGSKLRIAVVMARLIQWQQLVQGLRSWLWTMGLKVSWPIWRTCAQGNPTHSIHLIHLLHGRM
jgi:hypothetical protein